MNARSLHRPAIILALAPLLLTFPPYARSQHRLASSDTKHAPASRTSDLQTAPEKAYVIGDGDVLGISVWNEPELKQTLPVRPDGKVTMPLIGSVQATGRTPSQLETAIAAGLSAYIHNPNVTVMVLKINSRTFNILGRVAKPGAYPLSGNLTVLDAIAEAGGFTAFAKEAHIYILRDTPDKHETRIRFNYKQVIKGQHAEQNILLKPQDTVIVP